MSRGGLATGIELESNLRIPRVWVKGVWGGVLRHV
eukprot:gene538-biopygen9134